MWADILKYILVAITSLGGSYLVARSTINAAKSKPPSSVRQDDIASIKTAMEMVNDSVEQINQLKQQGALRDQRIAELDEQLRRSRYRVEMTLGNLGGDPVMVDASVARIPVQDQTTVPGN